MLADGELTPDDGATADATLRFKVTHENIQLIRDFYQNTPAPRARLFAGRTVCDVRATADATNATTDARADADSDASTATSTTAAVTNAYTVADTATNAADATAE